MHFHAERGNDQYAQALKKAGPERGTERKGQKRFGYFPPGRAGFSKVTRCKSETDRSRYRRNGYVLRPKL